MADPVTAASIRCRNDLKLYETLLADPLVMRVNERIARHEQDNPMNLRRRLLATSVHLSERMAPDLHEMAVDCMDRLDLDIRPELYAYAGPPEDYDQNEDDGARQGYDSRIKRDSGIGLNHGSNRPECLCKGDHIKGHGYCL